jgi:hypothetical protein
MQCGRTEGYLTELTICLPWHEDVLRSEEIVPYIRNLDTRWTNTVTFIPQLLYPHDKKNLALATKEVERSSEPLGAEQNKEIYAPTENRTPIPQMSSP